MDNEERKDMVLGMLNSACEDLENVYEQIAKDYYKSFMPTSSYKKVEEMSKAVQRIVEEFIPKN
jgi:hypoxanthine-guanine phosphoribosyltransferase